jgi:uncharacterized protein YgbK (DUF1537 family)
MENSIPFFYILTNSRSLTEKEAEKINRDIIKQIILVNKRHQYKLIFISRSDSTLRGHFQIEPAAIRSELKIGGNEVQYPTYFVPAFLEAGRYTIEDSQYMKDGDHLIPVSETEFAKDNVFGYHYSNLTDYICEKTFNDKIRRFIHSLSINQLRENKLNTNIEQLHAIKNAVYVIVNALDYYDLQKFSLALLQLVLRTESPFVLRTSSSLPKAISGITDKPFLTKSELIKKSGPGIFIVGSHVNKTTLQLENLLKQENIEGIELDASQMIDKTDQLLSTTINKIENIAKTGKTPVTYTSRNEIRLDNASEKLELGNRISEFLVNLVKNLPFTPTYLIAKGGITSNDILTKGLSVKKARVAGQIITGVPVITTDSTNLYPNLPYIIFPGNVGDENALATVYNLLK